MRVLDLGGSITDYHCTKKILTSLCFLVDFSKKALSLSKECWRVRGWGKFIHSDLFSNIHNKFDLIVTNLPYIAKDDFVIYKRNYTSWTTRSSLRGQSGLEIIKVFLKVLRDIWIKWNFCIEFGKGKLFIKGRVAWSNLTKLFHKDLIT